VTVSGEDGCAFTLASQIVIGLIRTVTTKDAVDAFGELVRFLKANEKELSTGDGSRTTYPMKC